MKKKNIPFLTDVFKEAYQDIKIFATIPDGFVVFKDYKLVIESGDVFYLNDYIGNIKTTRIPELQGKLEMLFKLFKS